MAEVILGGSLINNLDNDEKILKTERAIKVLNFDC